VPLFATSICGCGLFVELAVTAESKYTVIAPEPCKTVGVAVGTIGVLVFVGCTELVEVFVGTGVVGVAVGTIGVFVGTGVVGVAVGTIGVFVGTGVVGVAVGTIGVFVGTGVVGVAVGGTGVFVFVG